MLDKKLKIAITGGIGSGKSVALKVLSESGYSVISCDEIAKTLFDKQSVKQKLKELFPLAVCDINAPVDRKIIAQAVFNDSEKLKALNELTHPLIMEEVMRLADTVDGVSVVEVPLLFEGGYQSFFDKVIVVVRTKQLRIESVKKRSIISEDEVLIRMKNQIDYDNFDFSDYVIVENNGDVDEFKAKILDTVKNLIK